MDKDPLVPGWDFNIFRDKTVILSFLSILLSGLLLSIRLAWWSYLLGLICLSVFLVILYFFRNPRRIIEYSSNVFYSPGDGTVSDITQVDFPLDSEQPFMRIGIFLSVFNVHIQRAPISGEVLKVTHHPGEHYPAYNPLASIENEQISMEIKSTYGTIIVKQISGILARKCFNYAMKGDQIHAGQRYGLIKFGSRVELFVPSTSEVMCEIGDKVFGGLTPLARMNQV